MSTSATIVEQLYIEEHGIRDLSWQEAAACRDSNTEPYFAEGRLPDRLIQRRAACPVVEACREYAIARPWIQGMWGGTTGPQRREIRRRRAAGLPDTPDEQTPRCRNNHLLDEANARPRSDGGIRCRQCVRDQWHARQRRAVAA